MNKIAPLIFFVICITSAVAQLPEFKYTEVFTKEANETVRSVLENEDKTFVIKRIDDNKTDIVLDVLDSNNQFTASFPLKFPITRIKKIGVIQNELTIFGVLEDGSSDILKLFNIDSETGKYEEKIIATLTAFGGYRTSYDVSISPNGKYFSMIPICCSSTSAKSALPCS